MNQLGGAEEDFENVPLADENQDSSTLSPSEVEGNCNSAKKYKNNETIICTEEASSVKDYTTNKNGNCSVAKSELVENQDVTQETKINPNHEHTKHDTIGDSQGGGDTLEVLYEGRTSNRTREHNENKQGGGDLYTTLLHADKDDTDDTTVYQSIMPAFISDGSGDCEMEHVKSILKKNGGFCSPKTVTFAEDLTDEINDMCNELSLMDWGGVQPYAVSDIILKYRTACAKEQTIPLDAILDQLQEIKNNVDHTARLDLRNIKVTREVINMLEVIFEIVNFRTIYLDISQFDSATSHDIFNIIDYYDPTLELILCGHRDDPKMWQSFNETITNNNNIVSISFREAVIEDAALRLIFEGINSNSNIKILRFDGCELNRAPTFMLANHLKGNYYLTELHLCFAEVYFKEADILAKFLTVNTSLKILNLNHNKLGDRGFDAITKGLIEQARKTEGVVVLMVADNRLSRRSAETLAAVIMQCPLLHSINVGLNNLTDAVIGEIKSALIESTTLRSFGLQSTLLTCTGLHDLVETCQINKSLRHLNISGNKAIQTDALNELADVIHRTTLVQIDLDDTNRCCADLQQYVEVVNKIRHMVAVNRLVWEDKEPDQYQAWGRQHSLICEPEFEPKGRSLTRSRTTTSKSRSRFKVVSVPETTVTAPLSPTHRFTVVSVSSTSFSVSSTVSAANETEVHNKEDTSPKEDGSTKFNIAAEITPFQEDISVKCEDTNSQSEPIFVNVDNSVVSNDSVAAATEQQQNINLSDSDPNQTLESTADTVAPSDCDDDIRRRQ